MKKYMNIFHSVHLSKNLNRCRINQILTIKKCLLGIEAHISHLRDGEGEVEGSRVQG